MGVLRVRVRVYARAAPLSSERPPPRYLERPGSTWRHREAAPAAARRLQSPARRLAAAPLALRRVHRVDLLRVLLRDRLALELHRRRELVAARQPVARDDRELLDPFDARKPLVGRVHGLLHRYAHLL